LKEINKCSLCGSKNLKFALETKDFMLGGNDKFKLYECKSCGLLFLNPLLNGKELEKYYPKDYYSYGVDKIKFLNQKVFLYNVFSYGGKYPLLKYILFPLARPIRTIKIAKKGKLLDVGCGSGNFLVIAKALGMDCFGVEPGKFDNEFAKKEGFKIFHGTLLDAKYPKDNFDCITLNHVFEHVENPGGTLLELKRILKKDGTITIAVPQKNNLAYFLFKKYWVQLDTPRHLYTYSAQNLKDYAKSCGLAVKKIRYVSSPFAFTGKLANWAKDKRFKLMQKIFNSMPFFVLLFSVSFLCNLFGIGDTVEIVMRK